MSKLLLTAELTRYRRLKDRTVSLTFTTQELTDINTIDELATTDALGILYFREAETITEDEVKVLDNYDEPLSDDRKTPSQRLRGVLWVLCKQSTPGFDFMDAGTKEETFTRFYKATMARIIESYKRQLEDQ